MKKHLYTVSYASARWMVKQTGTRVVKMSNVRPLTLMFFLDKVYGYESFLLFETVHASLDPS